MGDRERSREGVMVPEPWTQGAEWAMKLLSECALAIAHAAPLSAFVDVRVLGHGERQCRKRAICSHALPNQNETSRTERNRAK
jgi:hypothetical protein